MNRTTQFWSVELLQGGNKAVTGTAVFAKRRETWSTTDAQFPQVPAAKDVESFPVEGLPAWVHNYDIKFVKGAPALLSPEKPTDSTSIQWIRDKPRRPLDFLSLTAICDAFFPRIYIRRHEMVPIGTISLSVYFHTNSEMLTEVGDQAVLGQARALRFNDGFFDQTGEIWSQEGELLATTSQFVYYRK